MPIDTEVNDFSTVESDVEFFDPIPPTEEKTQPKTTVSVRFALGKSGGIHVVPQKAPENLPEARKGALRYARVHQG